MIGVNWLEGEEDNGVVVIPAVEAVMVAEIMLLEDVLVTDELAKFHPFICTPCITIPVLEMVIVVGTHDPSVELRGVMT